MKLFVRQISLVAGGLNIGIFIVGFTLASQSLMLTALLSGLACALGFYLNKEDES